MFKVNSDPSKNRLYITLEKLEDAIIKPILKDLTSHVEKLSTGFTCLVDIRNMSYEEHADGAEYVEIIQGALRDAGMKKVVRVVDNANLDSQTVMNERSSTLGYTGEAANSIADAEKLLDS